MTDISLDNLGTQTSDSIGWFTGNTTLTNLREPAVNRQHTRVAFVGGSDSAPLLWVHRMNGEAPALPSACHGWQDPTGNVFTSLTWSPDGTSLAWQEGDGIWVSSGQDTCGTPGASKLIVAGASYPDWGPASVPTSRPTPPPPGDGGGDGGAGGGGTGDGGSGSTGGGTTTTKPATPITSTPRADAAVQGGTGTTTASTAGPKSWSFACGRACTVSGKVTVPSSIARKAGLRAGTVVATGSVKLTKKGRAKLVVRPTAAGRRALAKLRGQKLTMKVTIKEGRKTRRVTRRVTLA